MIKLNKLIPISDNFTTAVVLTKEEFNEVEVGKGHENDRDMVVGVAEILRMVDDMNNRKEIAEAMLRKFKLNLGSSGIWRSITSYLRP